MYKMDKCCRKVHLVPDSDQKTNFSCYYSAKAWTLTLLNICPAPFSLVEW